LVAYKRKFHKFNFRIYSNGHDINIAKLYPPVEFPVSRGTPMIAPHIKWEHSDDHFVMHFDDDDSAKCAERRVKISLNDVEYEYIQGHCIDGK
jgi:fatty acid synthase, animal type